MTLIAWVLVFAPLLSLAVVICFAPAVWSGNMALRERTGMAIRDLFMSSVIALVAADFLELITVNPPVIFWLLVLAYLSIPVTNAIWLVIFLRGRYA